MNPIEAGLVAAFAVCAVANWGAVAVPPARADPPRIAATKLGATVTLVVLAALAGDMAGGARAALVVATVLCLAGDAFLLGVSEGRFLAGLASFAAGHTAYVVTALLVGVAFPRLLAAVPFLVVLFGFRFASRTVPAARRRDPVLGAAVVGYAAVIAAMVVTVTGTPAWSAAAGAMTFAVSDWMIGYDRFVRPFRHARPAVMATYHVGQLLLITGLIAGG